MPRTTWRSSVPAAEVDIPAESYDGCSIGRVVGTPADLFTKDKRRYAKSFDVVKLNWTFHDKRRFAADYETSAKDIRELGLLAVVKVSRDATHVHGLGDHEQWWPELWELYSSFLRCDVLAAILWQCPPSFKCCDATISALAQLCHSLRETGARHVFEFRNASWYERPEVVQILRSNGCCLAWLHLKESIARPFTNESGWSPQTRTAYFAYLQLHGTQGRAIGSYSAHELSDIAGKLPEAAIVLFCQVDVPAHARTGAQMFRQLLGLAHSASPQVSSDQVRAHTRVSEVSGRVVRVDRLQAVLDVDGRRAVLGLNHCRDMAKAPCVGDLLHSLCIEAEDGDVLRVSILPDLPESTLLDELADSTLQPSASLALQTVSSTERCTVVAKAAPARRVWKPASAARWSRHSRSIAADEAVAESEDSEASEEVDTALKHDGDYVPTVAMPIASALQLRVDMTRRLRIISWGKARLDRAPEADLHITCNHKKFHYLTRNNKHLTKLNGLDVEVQEQILSCGFFSSWIQEVVLRIERDDVRSLALHCFKGTHRSVAAAEILRERYYPAATIEHLSLRYIRPGRPDGPARR